MPAPVQLRLTPEGFATREGTGRPRWPHRWEKVTHFVFDTKRNGHPHFRVRGRWGFIWIDIELAIPPVDSAAIAQKVHDWIMSKNPNATFGGHLSSAKKI